MGWSSAWAAEAVRPAGVIAMWPEPLTADTTLTGEHTFTVTTRAGDGRAVAQVLALHNTDAGYGLFGEMQIIDPNGGPRQRVRALALLVRQALHTAADLGITRAHTDVDATRPALLDFARRMAGRPGYHADRDRIRIGGLIHEMRTAALDATDADGNLTGDPIADL